MLRLLDLPNIRAFVNFSEIELFRDSVGHTIRHISKQKYSLRFRSFDECIKEQL